MALVNLKSTIRNIYNLQFTILEPVIITSQLLSSDATIETCSSERVNLHSGVKFGIEICIQKGTRRPS